jgi:hypothetical protein
MSAGRAAEGVEGSGFSQPCWGGRRKEKVVVVVVVIERGRKNWHSRSWRSSPGPGLARELLAEMQNMLELLVRRLGVLIVWPLLVGFWERRGEEGESEGQKEGIEERRKDWKWNEMGWIPTQVDKYV